MSLRFDRNTPPRWNPRTSCIEFTCVDSHTRTPVHCAVSRAALEDSTGEALDGPGCLTTFARHLGRIANVANSLGATRDIAAGSVFIDSDDLLEHFPVPVAAQELGKVLAHDAAARP